MKNRLVLLGLVFSLATTILISSCTKEPERNTFPLSAEIFFSVDDSQVAFTALTHSATSWTWDFGDGNSSNEQNPVYVYPDGGYYTATLTATDNSGNTVIKESNLAVALPPRALLVGDHTASGYNGKTWKLTTTHPVEDKIANPDSKLSYFAPDVVKELPPNAFGMYLGLGEIYDDEYTFYDDGSYSHDLKNDSATFAGLLYSSLLAQQGLTSIEKMAGAAVFGADAFAISTYTPEENATFVFNEGEDFTIGTLPDYATGLHPLGFPIVTYPGVMTIDFPNSTEFIGVMDFQRKVIMQDITQNTMRLVMFMTLDPAAIVNPDPLIVLSTTVLVLTFEAVY
jgi:hypothetical protein